MLKKNKRSQMMKINSRLYQYLIILLATVNPSFVSAADNDVKNAQQQNEMPSPPSGPYRSLLNNKINQTSQIKKQPAQGIAQSQFAERLPQQMRPPVAPQAWTNNGPHQQMLAPNWNQNIPPQPRYVQRPSLQQMRRAVTPPAWGNNNAPHQQMMAPNWNRKFPPPPRIHPPLAPPAWANNAPHQQMRVPNWNQNIPPQPQWKQLNVPDWVKNPPHGPKPPKWVTNPPAPPAWVIQPRQQSVYQYRNHGRN